MSDKINVSKPSEKRNNGGSTRPPRPQRSSAPAQPKEKK